MNAKLLSENLGLSGSSGSLVKAGLLSLFFLAAPAGATIVTNCTDADLRAAVAAGGTVEFACDGTVVLSSTLNITRDTMLDGRGHEVIISGGDSVRIFHVNSNVNFTIDGLTVANGISTNGAGLFNDGGAIVLLNAVFQNNNAWVNQAYPGPNGGGVYNKAGTVNATNCTFVGNAASPPPQSWSWGNAQGGAIRNENGEVHLDNCIFVHNKAYGGDFVSFEGAAFPEGDGGAIYSDGTLTAAACAFLENSASGAQGYFTTGTSCPGGLGHGGAIFNSGTMLVEQSVFSGNSGIGGLSGKFQLGDSASGGWGRGGAIFNSGSLFVRSSALFSNAVCGGDVYYVGVLDGPVGGDGGSGVGGAICNAGSLVLTSSTITGNTAVGGAGGLGLEGLPISDIATDGGPGGPGGNAFGAGLFNSGTISLVNCTVAENAASGGSGGTGGTGGTGFYAGGAGGPGGTGGSGCGGICSSSGSMTVTNCTIALNSAQYGFGGAGGAGGMSEFPYQNPRGPWPSGPTGSNGMAVGGFNIAGGRLINTLVAANAPWNSSGILTDAGHNLSSDGSCAFTNVGSLNNVDAKLGLLGDNGGPTWTMALLPGSPAINAADDAAAPPTDQRGVLRPAGAASDIGAYECGPPVIITAPATQTVEQGADTTLWLDAAYDGPFTFLWFFNETNLVSCSAQFELQLTNCQFAQSGSYCVVVTNSFGAVTSGPVALNVIPFVDRRPVPGVRLVGQGEAPVELEYRDTLAPGDNWASLNAATLGGTPQFCFDLTEPLPPQRFYRVSLGGLPGVLPVLDLHMVPAIALTGNVGDALRLDYINAIGPTDAWVTLDTVTLTNTSQLYFDVSAPGQPRRLYRIVPGP